MRYIKIPKTISALWWRIGLPFPRNQISLAHEDFETDPVEYSRMCGKDEYILDARIFQSKLIRELLT